MNTPFWVDYGDSRWSLLNKLRPGRGKERCDFCERKFRSNARRYRTKTWGPNHDEVAEYHTTCLIGQIDPTIYDIPMGGL